MPWKKAPPELCRRFDELMAGYAGQHRKMFGYPVCFVGGNMFSGLFADALFIRLPEKDRAAIVRENDEVAVLEPMPGRPMREYMVIPETSLDDGTFTKKWLDRSFRYVSSLEPKKAGRKASAKG
jgi:hypothetical protein